MGLSITGYVLEPPRVGGANSPYTLTPSNFVSNTGTFNTAFPSNESNPRVEYLVQVLSETYSGPTGPNGAYSLPDARLFWTKNEGEVQSGAQIPFQRFDYSGQDQRFKTLQGVAVASLGALQTDANTNRLAVTPIPSMTSLTNFPIRITASSPAASTFTPTISLVTNDASFTSPASGTVQLSRSTGNLNWNTTDLSTHQGKEIFFQRQSFAFPDETTGSIGVIGTDALVLNPIPKTGQFPLLKFGFGGFVTATEVSSFSPNPTAGTVEWQTGTGILKLNSGDLVTYAGRPLIYDGVALSLFQVAATSVGTVTSPGTVTYNSSEDLFFRISGVVQFPEVLFVTAFTSGKRGEVQVRTSDGQVQFSSADQSKYGAQAVQVVKSGVSIEKGHSINLFRSPVDPGNTSSDVVDLKAFYTVDSATLADPMIGQPSVFLPAVPLDDPSLVVRVEQGSGSSPTPETLPRLDVAVPPTGRGYLLDFEARQLLYGQHRNQEIQPTPAAAFGSLQLPAYPVYESGLVVEVEATPGAGDWQTYTLDEDFVIDYPSGVITYTQTDGEEIVASTGSTSSSTFTDTSQDFTALGVVAGDYLLVLSGSSKGVYVVSTVGTATLTVETIFPAIEFNLPYEIRRSREVLADRFFREVVPVDPNTSIERLVNLGATTNSPRLSIDTTYAAVSRIRFGTSTFSVAFNQVANDGAFTSPGSLAQGVVEVSLSTGNLNFSTTDVTAGADAYWARALTLGSDYSLQAGLGLVEFSERLLENEEVVLNYAHLDDVLSDGTVVKSPVSGERGVFLVSKELVQDHPSPVSTLSFNPLGREVAATPSPAAFRGGRPQVVGDQVSFAASTVTFLTDSTVTDALPHGATVDPDENVYVDYYIYGAIGGEKAFTVLQTPMATVTVTIEEGATAFTIEGDRTADFAANYLLRVEGSEIYLIGSSSYNGTLTIITLDQSPPQAFKSDQLNPTLEVSSGEVRRVASGGNPAYFVTEASSFDTVSRGSTKLKLLGDVSASYPAGVVVLFTDGATYQDYNIVEGSEYDPASNRTKVTLGTNTSQQYGPSLTTLKRTVRAILASPSAEVSTSRPPLLDLPYYVYRKVEGATGELLTEVTDYTIDGSGKVSFTDPLTQQEELGVFYTGALILEAGRRTRATWTHAIVPDTSNGLLNQVLKMDYMAYLPDTFFYRVETMTNFRAEMAQQFEDEAKASAPSQGPVLENSAGAALYEQGNESLYFQELHLANQDLVARPTLKYFNDAINLLEDYLQACDGRFVGDRDGRFLFDGNTTNPVRSSFSLATNQIDDYIQVTSSQTLKAYKAAGYSRFFPTSRRCLGDTENPSGLETGDTVFDTGYKPLTAVNLVQRRFPFALVTTAAAAGATQLAVDDGNGNTTYARPSFANNMVIEIIAQNGTVLDATGKTITSFSGTTLNLSGGVATAIPAGSTVRLSPDDTTYRQTYLVGVDVKVNANDGLVTYVDPADVPNPPFTPKSFTSVEQWDVLVGTFRGDTEPFRFPALDGTVSDDDGDVQTPLLTPQAASERAQNAHNTSPSGAGLLSQEASYLALVLFQTTNTTTATGNVSGTTVTITSPATFPITPKRGDLVRFLTGTFGPSNYYRVLSGTSTTAVLETSIGTATGFTFAITAVTPVVAAGTAAVTVSGTTFTDTGVDFVAAGVVPGHTVVVTSGTNDLKRRQVSAVTTNTLTLTASLTNTSNFAYRVENPTVTFGSAATSSFELLRNNLEAQKDVLSDNADSEISSLNSYISQVGSTLTTSANGQTTLPTTFTDTSVNFTTAGVGTSDFLYITAGANIGVYAIASVDSSTSLTISGAFISSLSGQSYKILRTTGVSLEGLNTVVDTLVNSQSALTNVQILLSTMTSITVTNDASAFAHAVLDADLTTRQAQNTARNSETATDAGNINSVMASIDRLYDSRFAWIDGRINLERGILAKQERAVAQREKALADIIKNLTKLLTT